MYLLESCAELVKYSFLVLLEIEEHRFILLKPTPVKVKRGKKIKSKKGTFKKLKK